LMIFVALPISMIGTAIPLSVHAMDISTDGFLTWTRTVASRLVQALFPRTNVSIMDLDQAVAVLAGATVLGFGLYGAANANYEKWLEKVQAREEHRAVEMERIRRRDGERREERQDSIRQLVSTL
jgi:hypothetical protein